MCGDRQRQKVDRQIPVEHFQRHCYNARIMMSSNSKLPIKSSSFGLCSTVFLLFFISLTQICSGEYYGKLIGKLSEIEHGVSGEVYAVDGRTLFIKDFTYDGQGPAAYFYVGSTKTPNVNGFRLRDEKGMTGPLKRYDKHGVTLTLPEGKTLNNLRWFSVYCDLYSVNFGDVKLPRGFEYPKPQKLAGLNGVHGVSSEPIVVVDSQTLLVPSFSYDGEAPDAKFWVGAGDRPSPQGVKLPDENGKINPLRRYDRKTIVLTLPGELTVQQIGHFGVWCEAFAVDFGHIKVPRGLNVPPSLNMLGVSPQSKLNCEILEDNLAFEVRWAVAGDSIVIQLVAKLDDGQYMAFGVSADPQRSLMVGGDVAVASVDKKTLQGYAVDYILDGKSQCSGSRGSCPDARVQPGTNSVRLLNAAMVNGYSIVTYQRPLAAADELDRPIRTNGSQAIIWAIGPLNERNEVSFHSHYLKGSDRLIEFGRPPTWNCPMPDTEYHQLDDDKNKKKNKEEIVLVAPTTRRPSRLPLPASAGATNPWIIPPIQCYEPEDGVYYANMGPTGGKHGYPAITGHVGWGIAWYINGLLIPEINVVRGRTYRFVVEGGDNYDVPARYHPFYITDDPVGGYEHKTPEERAKVKIFAGARQDKSGAVVPTGAGRSCNWIPDSSAPEADDFASFGAYQRVLTLKCEPGEPGLIQWTPDANTPDTVYYQCFTHRYLGWKINVLDSCDDPQAEASIRHEIYAQAPVNHEETGDMQKAESIQVSSKVTSMPDYYLSNSGQQNHHNQPQSHQNHADYQRNHYHNYYHNDYSHYPSNKLQLTNAYVRSPYKSSSMPIASALKQQYHHQPTYYNNHYSHQSLVRVHPDRNTSPIIYYRRQSIPIAHYHQNQWDASKLQEPQPQVSLSHSNNFLPDHLSRPVVKFTYPQATVNNNNQQQQQQQYLHPKLPLIQQLYRYPTIKKSNDPSEQFIYRQQTPQPQMQSKIFTDDTAAAVSSAAEIRNFAEPLNNGFNPDSIVIEGGFKPIIRDNGMKNTFQKWDFPQIYRNINQRGAADTKEWSKKAKIRLEKIKQRLHNHENEGGDDMEMAADSLDIHYLPTRFAPEAGARLIAYDGQEVDDSSLTRSILSVSKNKNIQANSKDHYRSFDKKLSKILSNRVPQFRKFRGELPPHISSESSSNYGKYSDKLNNRTKRSVDFDVSSPSSTGETLVNNLGYIFLTFVLYFAI